MTVVELVDLKSNRTVNRALYRMVNSERKHYVDDVTGELNYTKLAEDVADECELYEKDGHTIPESVFEYVTRYK